MARKVAHDRRGRSTRTGRHGHALLVVVVAFGLAIAMPASADAASITEFPLAAGDHPGPPIAGPDGDVWFTVSGTTPGIGRIAPSGAITEFGAGDGLSPGSDPTEIALGADGNLWFTDLGTTPAIGRITPSGAITEYPLGTAMGPQLILAGSDGNIWFVEYHAGEAKIGQITPAGTIATFDTTDGLNPGSQPNAMTLGPDGNIWFTDPGSTYAIGRITPAGQIEEYPNPGHMPDDITVGQDGNLWFTNDFGPIDRITTSGTISEFEAGLQPSADPDAITTGAEGDVWFDDQYGSIRGVGKVSPDGTITEFTSGLSAGLPTGLTAGLDGNIWVLQAQSLPEAPQSVDEITPTGTITNITAGLIPAGGEDGDSIVTGPDGNLWFNDAASTGAIGKISLQIPPTASTGPASAITSQGATVSGSVNPLGSETAVSFQYGTTPALGASAAAGTLPASGSPSPVSASLAGLPAGTLVYYRVVASNIGGTTYGALATFTTSPALPSKPPPPQATPSAVASVTLGNQRITLTTPTGCRAKRSSLKVTLSSSTIRGSHGAKLRFLSAALYIERGMRHTRHEKRRTRHGSRRVIVTYFTANATVRRLPATLTLPLGSLGAGTHKLTAKLTYRETRRVHGRRRNVTVTKSLSAKFSVCQS